MSAVVLAAKLEQTVTGDMTLRPDSRQQRILKIKKNICCYVVFLLSTKMKKNAEFQQRNERFLLLSLTC